MTMMTPFELIRVADASLLHPHAIPLTGRAPPFPWSDLSQKISDLFDRPHFSIIPETIEWRKREDLYEGLGENQESLALSFSQIEGEALWVMSKECSDELSAWFLEGQINPHEIDDKEILHSFYHFFALESLYQATTLMPRESPSPLLSKTKRLFNEKALCWEITLKLGERRLKGRVILPEKFRLSWIHYFSTNAPTESQTHLAKQSEIELVLRAGSVALSYDEWLTVKSGDCLLIDHASFNPDTFQGKIDLLIEGKPFFRGKIEKGNLKILELPPFQEVTSMPKPPIDDDDEENESEFSDYDLTEEEEEEEEDEFESLDSDFFDEDEEDEDFLDEEGNEEQEASLDELNQSLGASGEKGQKKASSTSETKEMPSSLSSEMEEDQKDAEEKKPSGPGKIPLTLTVEIARIKMPLEKFLQLEPGNVLRLEKKAQDLVNISINGEVVAKGELILIGEALAIRLDEVGQ